jgi:ATP-dependent DNA ligase
MLIQSQKEWSQMANEFSMLAQTYKKQDVAGWFVSVKLDGLRCIWDSGFSRGKKAGEVSYGDWDDQRIATGLWTRRRKPIMAPDWFLDKLPKIILDGELWAGNGNFQDAVSCCRKYIPIDEEWKNIQYKVFDSPYPLAIGVPLEANLSYEPRLRVYEETLDMLKARIPELCVEQTLLPMNKDRIPDVIESMLKMVVEEGGEGLMFRYPGSVWEPRRSKFLLKYKPFIDDECEIKGFKYGDGKYEGMIGCLLVEWKGKQFELSGMTDQYRELEDLALQDDKIPGAIVKDIVDGKYLKRGDKINFRYVRLTRDGIPREARYQRKHIEVD